MSQWSEGLWLSVLPPKCSASSQGAPSLHTRAVGTHSEQWQPTTAASRCRPDSSLELENRWVVLEIRVFVSGPSVCLAGSKLMCLRGVWAGRVVGNFSFLLWKQACGVDMCILPWFLWCHLFCLSVFFSLSTVRFVFYVFFFLLEYRVFRIPSLASPWSALSPSHSPGADSSANHQKTTGKHWVLFD